MVVSKTNLIVKLNLKTMDSLVYKIPNDYQALNLCYDGEFFWLTPRFGNLVMRWDESSNSYEEIKFPVETEEYALLGGVVIGDSIVFFPHRANYVLRVNRNSLAVTHDFVLENNLKTISTYKYGALVTNSDILLAFLGNRTIQEFDTKTGEMRIHQLKADLDNERKIRLGSQYRRAKGIFSCEGEDLDIDLWMEMFLSDPKTQSVGKKIYEALFEKK
jgi:hypothetical protein